MGRRNRSHSAVTSGFVPFIKYLQDDVTGTTFMDLLELGGRKTKMITMYSLKKKLAASPGCSWQKCRPEAWF